MTPSSRARVIWLVLALSYVLCVAGAVTTTAVDWQDPTVLPYAAGFILLGVGATTAGALVCARVPGNAVGPVLLAMGLGLGVLLSTGAYAELSMGELGPLPGAAWAAWLGLWLSIPVFFGLTSSLLLLFPDGHLVSPRWRGAAWFTAAGVSLATLSSAFTPRRLSPGFDNPVGATAAAADLVRAVEDGTDLLALPVLVIAAAALATRLRRSRGVERQQLKWFTYVAAIVGVRLGLTAITQGVANDLAFLGALYALASLPAVAGVAVMRYGLYEIDVVIKRTLVYGPLTAALIVTYLVLVLVLQPVLRPLAGDSNLAVAASTLAVAALFRPLRARIQALVDRRFYRERYDAVCTLEGFTARLRDELDLDTLGSDLQAVVRDTMQPTHMSMWLRDSEAAR